MTFKYFPDGPDTATGHSMALDAAVAYSEGQKCSREAASDLTASLTSCVGECTTEEFNSLVFGAVHLLLEISQKLSTKPV